MDFEYQYIRLCVDGVRRFGKNCRRCLIVLAPKGSAGRELVVFADEHDAVRIAMRAFPDKVRTIRDVSVWPDFAVKSLCGFGIAADTVTIREGESGELYAAVAFRDVITGVSHEYGTNVVDGILFAVATKTEMLMPRELFERISSASAGRDKVRLPVGSVPEEVIRERMAQAVRDEDYELASRLRDELKRRDASRQAPPPTEVND